MGPTATPIDLLTLVVLVPCALVAAWVLFRIVRGMQRRFRIFTRGTVSFMLFSLLAFTLIDLFALGHKLRHEDQFHRRESDTEHICQAVRALGGDPAPRSRRVFKRGEVASYLRDVQSLIASKLPDDEDLDDFEIIAVDVAHQPSFDASGGNRWKTRAVLYSDDDTVVLDGSVKLRHDRDGRPQIADMDFELKSPRHYHRSALKKLVESAEFLRKDYRYNSGCRKFSRIDP